MERKPLNQREKIEKYYDTLIAQGSAGLSSDIITYLLLCIVMMILFIPVQTFFEEENRGPLFAVVWCFTMLGTMAITFYMQKYHTVTYEKNRTEAVGEKLRYMPIDRKENRRYLFGKLIAFLKKITIIGLVEQLGVTLIAYHTISLWNVFYILVLTFVIPLLLCGWVIVARDIEPRK